MAYLVIKTIKGRQYRYLQRSWREGKKVRTQAVSLGPVAGTARKRKAYAVGTPRTSLDQDDDYIRGMAAWLREGEKFDAWQRKTFGETGAERRDRLHQEKLDNLHEAFGLRMPGEASTARGTRKRYGEGEIE